MLPTLLTPPSNFTKRVVPVFWNRFIACSWDTNSSNGAGYRVEREKNIAIDIEGIHFDVGFRADLVINGCFIVELKSVEQLARIHSKQLLTYLKLTGFRLGLLINFGEELLKDGIKRVAN